MTESQEDTRAVDTPKAASERDMSGRDRMISNVLVSWASHFIFIIAGFILPRMMDRHLGKELLGVWDFGWSVVAWFYLVQGGMASSVNRYVAKHRAADDIAELNGFVSSALCLLGVAGLLVLGLSVGTALALPHWFSARLGDNLREAQWVIFFLGSSLVMEVTFSPFGGVLTGCHRWEIYNFTKSGWYIVTVTAMIIVLLMGGGLRELGLTYLIGELLTGVTRLIFAYRVCQGLKVRPGLVNRKAIKNIFAFGGKTLIPALSVLMQNQATAIIIMGYLGPAALALYSRPLQLARHVGTLVSKMSFVLTPTVSSMQSTDNLRDIRELLLKSSGYACHLSLPMALVMIIFGGPILRLWMGPDYERTLIPAILMLAYLSHMMNMPLRSCLVGLNAHGRPGLAQLIGSLCAVGAGFVVVHWFHLKLVAVALSVAVPMITINTVYIPFYACRRLDLPMRHYLVRARIWPAIRTAPFAVCLLGARVLFRDAPLIGLAAGLSIGGLCLIAIYWRYVLPQRIKARVWRVFPSLRPVA